MTPKTQHAAREEHKPRRNYKFRQHRRASRRHFERRWRERIECEPPAWNALATEFKNATGPKGSTLLVLYSYQLETTRWLARMNKKDVVITYSHKLRQPVTVWEASSDLEKKAFAEMRNDE